MNLGDIVTGQVLYFHFTTRQFSTGTPITSASLVVSVYKDDSVTQSTSGITTTFSGGFDSVAGLVSVKIDTSSDGTFYAAGHDFSVVITAGTADSVSIIGEVVGYFSIQNRYTDKTGYALTSAYDPAKTAAQAGDAMALTTGERTSVGTAVWASATRTLTSFGTLIADIWANVSRTLTDKTGFSLTSAYDPAKTAAQAGDVMKVDSGTGANQVDLTSGKVNVGKMNDADVLGTGAPTDLWRGT